MAAMPGLLDLDVAKKLYENMKAIVDMEVSLRMAVIEKVSNNLIVPVLLILRGVLAIFSLRKNQ